MRSIRIGGLALLLIAGCAHQQKPTGTAPAESAFERAYEAVASGDKETAHESGYFFEKASDGVRVVHEVPAGGLGQDVSDAAITKSVQSRIGNAPNVQVATEEGVVTLRGSVDSRAQATQAIQQALELDGVAAVRSQLQYPSLRAKAGD
jgi:osmotically-inducible protein OsmY